MENKFIIESPAFKYGEQIPEEFTADGKNISPPLKWEKFPRDAEEYALICEDPDAPKMAPFIHWVVYGIPADVLELHKGLPLSDTVENFVQGVNSAGKVGYFGPKPPAETGVHRYYFRLFALDKQLNLRPGLSKDELMDAIRDHILGEAELLGKYQYH